MAGSAHGRPAPAARERDRQGRLLTCEHDERRVTRTEYDGTTSVIADNFDGKPLDGVNVFNSEAELIGRIDLPERCANVCFGGLYPRRISARFDE